ncbi:MAG: hypothetical protein HY226_03595 [Candidatus Vogelbacteria bacterium]|nr:hypothetical protein [Candidatus Vogelbacteria bacterium]
MNIVNSNLGLKRALFHIVSTIAIGFVAAKLLGVMALCVAFVVVGFIEHDRRFYEALQKYLVERFGGFMSDEEKAFPPKLSGILPMIGSLIVALTFLTQSQFGLMIMIMALGDPAARIFGIMFSQKFGNDKFRLPWAKNKSMAGFAAIWTVAAILCALWGYAWSSVVLISSATALAESLGSRAAWYRDDNLTMPLTSVLVMPFCT